MARRALRPPSARQPARRRDYYVFVASEGNDRIALVRFGPDGARVERERKIGTNPTELAGPHGLYVSPDGKWYYVTTAHGTPNGALGSSRPRTTTQAGRVELGRFPATVQVSPDGHYAWVVNFNLYGDMVPSSVSVVYDRRDAGGAPHPDLRDAARLAALAGWHPAILGLHDERRAGRDRRGQHGVSRGPSC